jgi:hypothetical protein
MAIVFGDDRQAIVNSAGENLMLVVGRIRKLQIRKEQRPRENPDEVFTGFVQQKSRS